MRYLQLRLRFPPDARHPMHQFLAEQTPVRRSYLRHWNFSNPERVTSLFEVVGDVERGYEEYVAALNDVETIVEYDVTPVDESSLYVYVTEVAGDHARRFRALLEDTDLLVVPPIEYGGDGEMIFEVAGDDDELRAIVGGLPDHLSVSVDRLGSYDAYRESSVAVLTDRQREALAVASELGYYKIPRRAGVRAVAERLGCSKSTAADHLRKAEARLVRTYGHGDGTVTR